MSGLYLVRQGIDQAALAAFAIARGASDDDYGYALHLALRIRFGEAGPQPFRMVQGPGAAQAAHLIGYARDPAALHAALALPPADPMVEAVFAGDPQVRAMPEEWRSGARYRFEVRVRPVVRFGARRRAARAADRRAWQARAGEIDAFVAACEKAQGEAPLDREAVYSQWLVQRLDGACALEHVALRQMRRINTVRARHGGRGLHASETPEAVFAGTLVVQDPDRFAALLAGGVGRHAAFGFGMLTLAPPGPAPQGG